MARVDPSVGPNGAFRHAGSRHAVAAHDDQSVSARAPPMIAP